MSTANEIELTTPYGDIDKVLELNIDSSSDAYLLQNVIKLPSTYTFSIWYRTEINSQITFNVLGESDIIDSTPMWKKYVKTITVETLDETNIYIMPSVNVASYFYEGYLTEGIIDTSWLPAPEDIESSISSVSSQYIQLADRFSWIVSSGNSQSNMTLTDKMYQLIATDINMGGRVTFSSLTDDNGTTMINGGKVLAKYLELKGITIYSNETYIDDEGNTQNIKTFSVDENGNVSINAASLTLTAGALATANDINNINSRLDNQDSDLAALESNINSDIARLDEDINGESGLHSQIANLQIANSEIVMNFGTLESDVDGLTGTINSTSEVWKKYIKIVDGAMIFGRHINDDGTEISEADQTSLKLENTSLSFSQDGSTVAQMTSKELYIRNAVITEGLKVASYIIKPRETGGVAFYKM